MTTRQESAAEVRRVLESVKALLAKPPAGKLSEADTRAAFIDPLLRALGYHAIGDIQREVYAKDSKEFLDYLLRVNGAARIAVEAKAIDRTLTDTDAAQVIQYCSILGIEWAVVTNAREWRLYHQFARAPLADKLIFRLDLVGWTTPAQFAALFDQLWLLSKEAFVGADGPAAWIQAQKVDAALRDALTNPASPEVRYLRKRLGERHLDVTAEDVAAWFKSRLSESPPTPSEAVEAAGPTSVESAREAGMTTPASAPVAAGEHINYWMVPAANRGDVSAQQVLRYWLNAGMWGFGESTPGRKWMRAGDHIAFYAAALGVVAHARLTGEPVLLVSEEEWPEPTPMEGPTYKLPLADVVWLDEPTAIDLPVRQTLDAFKARDPGSNWSWFVQTTRRLGRGDFLRLTGHGG